MDNQDNSSSSPFDSDSIMEQLIVGTSVEIEIPEYGNQFFRTFFEDLGIFIPEPYFSMLMNSHFIVDFLAIALCGDLKRNGCSLNMDGTQSIKNEPIESDGRDSPIERNTTKTDGSTCADVTNILSCSIEDGNGMDRLEI